MMVGQPGMITLTTDFGDSYYVGEMKGTIMKVNPQAEIVDVTHSVERHNIVGGAFILSRIWRHFPKNAIHVAVVDPGVGSQRKAIALQTDYCTLVGPDNGMLRWALKDQKVERVVELDVRLIKERAGIGEVSSTFHGRDIFAPAAALVSRGVDLDALGKRLGDLERLNLREDTVIHVDRFGNIITTIAKELRPGANVMVLHGARRYDAAVARTFSDVEAGKLVVLTGSHGLIEVDVNQGNAAERLGVRAGDAIKVEYAD